MRLVYRLRVVLAGGLAALSFATAAGAQAIQYTYDALGRLVSVSYPNGHATTYAYDAAGNRNLVKSGVGIPLSAQPAQTAAMSLPAGVVLAQPTDDYKPGEGGEASTASGTTSEGSGVQ